MHPCLSSLSWRCRAFGRLELSPVRCVLVPLCPVAVLCPGRRGSCAPPSHSEASARKRACHSPTLVWRRRWYCPGGENSFIPSIHLWVCEPVCDNVIVLTQLRCQGAILRMEATKRLVRGLLSSPHACPPPQLFSLVCFVLFS